MMEDPALYLARLEHHLGLRSLERIGDHARNISELVIYLVRGTDVATWPQAHEEKFKAKRETANVPGETDDK